MNSQRSISAPPPSSRPRKGSIRRTDGLVPSSRAPPATPQGAADRAERRRPAGFDQDVGDDSASTTISSASGSDGAAGREGRAGREEDLRASRDGEVAGQLVDEMRSSSRRAATCKGARAVKNEDAPLRKCGFRGGAVVEASVRAGRGGARRGRRVGDRQRPTELYAVGSEGGSASKQAGRQADRRSSREAEERTHLGSGHSGRARAVTLFQQPSGIIQTCATGGRSLCAVPVRASARGGGRTSGRARKASVPATDDELGTRRLSLERV